MTNTEWQLSGNMAERYEEYLVPVIFAPWANELIMHGGLASGDSLLDLACGTGIVARLAARSGMTATGGDINPGMLAVAKESAAGLDATFHSADAQDLPFEDECFDAVICQQGLQFFPDKPAAVSESLRVLKPGGRAVFCTARGLEENPLMQAQVAAFAVFPIRTRFGPCSKVRVLGRSQ
jgi:ubiquinone/menaquinone biosynthesis C-methylase UbiE